MRRPLISLAAALGLMLMAWPATAAQEAPPFAVLDACSGDVKVGTADADVWTTGQAGFVLGDKQSLKVGPKSQGTVRFTEGDLVTLVPENTQVSLQDLFLKAKLEKMRGKIVKPAEDAQQTKMTVTPLTGVRGTDAAEGKAEDPNRLHYWDENAPGK